MIDFVQIPNDSSFNDIAYIFSIWVQESEIILPHGTCCAICHCYVYKYNLCKLKYLCTFRMLHSTSLEICGTNHPTIRNGKEAWDQIHEGILEVGVMCILAWFHLHIFLHITHALSLEQVIVKSIVILSVGPSLQNCTLYRYNPNNWSGVVIWHFKLWI